MYHLRGKRNDAEFFLEITLSNKVPETTKISDISSLKKTYFESFNQALSTMKIPVKHLTRERKLLLIRGLVRWR